MAQRGAVYLVLERADGMTPVYLRTHTKFMPGYYTLASGQLDDGETPLQGAIRETLEEIGVVVKPEDATFIHTQARHTAADGTDWLDYYFRATKWEGEPVCCEPAKHGEVEWCSLDNLKEPFLPYIAAAIKSWRSGQTYSEFKH